MLQVLKHFDPDCNVFGLEPLKDSTHHRFPIALFITPPPHEKISFDCDQNLTNFMQVDNTYNDNKLYQICVKHSTIRAKNHWCITIHCQNEQESLYGYIMQHIKLYFDYSMYA